MGNSKEFILLWYVYNSKVNTYNSSYTIIKSWIFLCWDDKNFKMKTTTSKIFMFWCYPFQNKIFSSDFLLFIKFEPQKILVCFERNEGLKSGRWVKSKKSLNHQSPVVEFSELPSFFTWLIWWAQTQKEQKIDTVQTYIYFPWTR